MFFSQQGATALRGDGHYWRLEKMYWCEDNGIAYVFGLSDTMALAAKVEPMADRIRVERAVGNEDAERGFVETTHAAKSWRQKRRVTARIEVTRQGLDIRNIVTNLVTGVSIRPSFQLPISSV